MNTNPNAKRILIFGDSNTWGRVPGDDNTKRFPINIRWTGVLQNLLGQQFEVIEEGLNGRTTNLDSPYKEGKNGAKYLFACLEAHNPIDLIILALGKNDLKVQYKRSPAEIGKGLEECIKIIQSEGKTASGYPPKVILLSTGIVEEKPRNRWGNSIIDFDGGKEKSISLVKIYRKLANKWNINFLDISDIITVSKIDGVHIDSGQHEKLAKAVYKDLIEHSLI